MTLLRWLLARAARDQVEILNHQADVSDPSNQQNCDSTSPVDDSMHVTRIDELFVTIGYLDNQGNITRRRITMLGLSNGSRPGMLYAICHEAMARQEIHIERIQSFVEPDGEHIAPRTFFRQFLDIDLDAYLLGVPISHQIGADSFWLRNHLRAPLSVLVVAGMYKDSIQRSAQEKVHAWAEFEILDTIQRRRFAEPSKLGIVDNLMGTIIKLRPRAKRLPRYIDEIATLAEEPRLRVANTLFEMLHVDGRVVGDKDTFMVSWQAMLDGVTDEL